MTDTIQIMDAVPIPKRTRPPMPKRTSKYPFEKMQVNQMFFIPGKEKNTMHSYFSTVQRKHNIKLTSRLMTMAPRDGGGWEPVEPGTEGAVTGVGVWRTA
jgi:hypothetical protein